MGLTESHCDSPLLYCLHNTPTQYTFCVRGWNDSLCFLHSSDPSIVSTWADPPIVSTWADPSIVSTWADPSIVSTWADLLGSSSLFTLSSTIIIIPCMACSHFLSSVYYNTTCLEALAVLFCIPLYKTLAVTGGRHVFSPTPLSFTDHSYGNNWTTYKKLCLLNTNNET